MNDLAPTPDWAKSSDGLIPAIIQDAQSLRVLMLGYMNAAALATTEKTGLVTFYSRSKQRLWQKGETSGHVLRVQSIKLDCDNDTLLIMALPKGPTCHLGTQTCFGEDEAPSLAILADLAATIKQRRMNPTDNSYTSKLFAEGRTRIAQKVGEEGLEVALAAATNAPNLTDESADLLYHLLVLLEDCNLDWRKVMTVLKKRKLSTNSR
jgi:phosphoribosyl-ATP pyrophosphohydrolase/phosphoribosyl-AMP cyclohydrolase